MYKLHKTHTQTKKLTNSQYDKIQRTAYTNYYQQAYKYTAGVKRTQSQDDEKQYYQITILYHPNTQKYEGIKKKHQ